MNSYRILLSFVVGFFILGSLSWSTNNATTQDTIANTFVVNEYEEVLSNYGLDSRMEDFGVAGISFAILKNGELDWAKGYGVLQKGGSEKVNTETMFSVGSVSKVGTAVLIMKLQELGLIDVDQDVNKYLTSWKVPENMYTRKKPVTLRHILSHTAGLTVHGFADFYPGEELPTTVQILEGKSPAKNRPVCVDIPVGDRFRYSGGGTTIAQLVIEDCMEGAQYNIAKKLLFQELGMKRSSYQNPLPERYGNIAKAHNRNGRPDALPRGYQAMPEAGASGLWTTPTDFSKLMAELMKAYDGNSKFLAQTTVKDMMTPVEPSDYGMGPRIKEENNHIQFSHGGANDSYRAHFIGSLTNKNGIVIFTNGARGTDLIRELLPLFDDMLFMH